MGIIGSIIGGVGSMVGGALAAKAATSGLNEMRNLANQSIDMYNAANSEEKARRDRIVNEDPNMSAEQQAARANMAEANAEAAQQMQQAAAIAGGATGATKQIAQAGAAAAAKMGQQAAVSGQQRQDQAWAAAQQRIAQNNSGIAGMRQYIGSTVNAAKQKQAEAIQGAAAGMSQAAGSLPW